MKTGNLIYCGLMLIMLTILGCGGGGGSDTPSETTKISGVASVAPISGGTVEVFKIVNGTKVTPALASGTTGADGAYNLSWQSHSGPVLVEVSGGTYIDAATGTPSPLAVPLRAVVSNASGTVSVAVTPFTDLAFQLAGANLTQAAISNANQQVAIIFKVDNIITTQPLAPSASALTAAPPAQRSYTLALAAFSQLVNDGDGTISGTITNLKGNTATAAAALQSAAATFFTTNSNNETGVKVAKLITTGSLPPGSTILGIQAKINLPSGVSVKNNSNGVLAGYLQWSGSATNSAIISGNLKGSELEIIFADITGIAVGEFAMLYYDAANNAPALSISPGYIVSGFDSSTGSTGPFSPAQYNLSITVQ